jgi:hypothetical protein
VGERRLEKFPQRLLKLGFVAGPHPPRNGNMNGHAIFAV